MKKAKEYSLDLLSMIIGSGIYAVGINIFTAPNNIAPGGVAGLATLINFLFETPIGLVVFLVNIPIVIWAIVEIGYKLVLKSAVAIVIMSFLIDFTKIFIQPYYGDYLLISIFAGVLEGAGLAIVFVRGSTTGGSDLIAKVLGKRFKHLSMGNLMLAVDAIVIVMSAFVFDSVESAMYACIVVFVSTSVIDAIMFGADRGRGKLFMIISSKEKEIADAILYELDRGVTYLKSRGGYSEKEGEMLLCAVNKYEIFKMQEIIKTIDKNAFVIVGDAGEITGEGFKALHSDDKTLMQIIEKAKKKLR
ncbi:MAG: YitT family protein [Clostridia bacterium]